MESLHYQCKSKKVNIVPSGPMLLGMLEDSQYKITKIGLKKGVLISFYKDGYSESYKPNSEEMLGEESVMDMLKVNSGKMQKTTVEMDHYFLTKNKVKNIDDDRTLLTISNTNL